MLLLISETKLNNTFPQCQFLLDGFHTPYREDGTDKGGELLLYVREHIPCMNIKFNFCTAFEAIVVEINLKKRKWLLICSYNPNKDVIDKHLNCIGKLLNDQYKKYENVIFIDGFNSETAEDTMQDFCSSYNLKNLVNKPTCFKNVDHPSCIDLILTNKSRCFQNISVIETRLSDFHRLTVTIMKTSFQKIGPKLINYRTYKYFDNEDFRKDLLVYTT